MLGVERNIGLQPVYSMVWAVLVLKVLSVRVIRNLAEQYALLCLVIDAYVIKPTAPTWAGSVL